VVETAAGRAHRRARLSAELPGACRHPAIAAVVCALLPLTGLAIIAFNIIDFLLPKRFKEAGTAQG
jgi:hypothetical protein